MENKVLPQYWESIQDDLGIGFGEGTLASGGGSGSTFCMSLHPSDICMSCANNLDPRLVDPLSAIQNRANQDLTLVDWSLTTNLTFAKTVAQRGTVCIPIVSSFSGEQSDRNTSLSHDGDNLILAVADNCDNTIPIIQSVGPVNMEVSVYQNKIV